MLRENVGVKLHTQIQNTMNRRKGSIDALMQQVSLGYLPPATEIPVLTRGNLVSTRT